jgi:hypothetical protein
VGGSKGILQKLNEGLLILNLDALQVDGQTEESGQDKALGLWEVEKRLFKDNESARDVLADLGIETLTEAEARSVLEKRVEIGK